MPTGKPMGAGSRSGAGLVWVAGACAASLLSVLLLDRAAATWSHDVLRGAAVFRALAHIVDPVPPLATVVFLAFGAGLWRGWRPGPSARTLLCACVAVLVAITVKEQMKFAFGRLWPETWINGNPSWIRDGAYGFAPFHGGQGWASFPSGHMTMITAPMAAVWCRHPRWRPLAALPVLLVAIGLYGADFHFVSDIVAGTLLGAVSAVLVVALIGDRPPIEFPRSRTTGTPE